MRVISETISVNLGTGERFRETIGDGEIRRLRSEDVRLGPREETFEEQAERAKMVAKIILAATEKFKEIETMAHYADGTPAHHGDFVIRHAPWETTDTALIITSITPGSDSCNASAIPLATKQGNHSWYPMGPQAQWTVTLKECMKLEVPGFPAEKAA